ncbi:hypothetical protein BDN70DRAFT_998712 [Pholiota conissans]|uniref:Uncharacterized protein n=1 Tax=Pholiota conissans TaxID=109636 RepID=A0A9P6CLI1_9AGAR|nr:hypothetical protein BDN70DRAFT_998712 [Pholiota conissans]
MTFAQPIQRSAPSASTSPSWLTSGVAAGSSAYSSGSAYLNNNNNGNTNGNGNTNTNTNSSTNSAYNSAYSSAGPSSGGSGGIFGVYSGGGGGGGSGGGMGSGGGGSGGNMGESRRHEQDLINAYEAEEERIINVLSRKLEQLREDKIDLENALEAESESHVNRLSRELQALRQANRELESQLAQANAQLQLKAHAGSPLPPLSSSSSSSSAKKKDSITTTTTEAERPNLSRMMSSPPEPSAALMLDAMQRENETLRNRLVDTERDYVRLSRLNEVYREELIEHRTRLGLSVDNLIGLTSSDRDPLAQPTHQRSRSSSVSSSPYGVMASASVRPRSVASTGTHVPPQLPHGVPIPRPPSQIHRPIHTHTLHAGSTVGAVSSSYAANTPLSSSPASSSYPLSPIYSLSGASSSDSYLHGASSSSPQYHRHRRSSSGAGATPASFVSVSTNLTSPPGSVPIGGVGMGVFTAGAFAVPQRGLSYPSVPPPSLSSSFGSPTVSMHRDASLSPVEPLSRRNSNAGIGRPGATGFERSVPVGGRVAETGSLAGGRRSRAGSVNLGLGSVGGTTGAGVLPETVVEDDADLLEGMELELDVEEEGGEDVGDGLDDVVGGGGMGRGRSAANAASAAKSR